MAGCGLQMIVVRKHIALTTEKITQLSGAGEIITGRLLKCHKVIAVFAADLQLLQIRQTVLHSIAQILRSVSCKYYDSAS